MPHPTEEKHLDKKSTEAVLNKIMKKFLWGYLKNETHYTGVRENLGLPESVSVRKYFLSCKVSHTF